MDKPTYRTSALSSFEHCAYAAYLSVIEKRRGRYNLFLARGTAVHKARSANMSQKITSGADMPVADCQDAACDCIRTLAAEDRLDCKSEELSGLSTPNAAGLIIDATVKVVQVDRELLQPRIRPVKVERTRFMSLPDWPFNLSYTPDVEDGNGYMYDCKTTKTTWRQGRADSEYQPSIYSLGYRSEQKTDPKAFVFDVITILKRSVRGYWLWTHRTDADIRAVLNRFLVMHEAMQAGIFQPAHRGDWKCSRRWCRWYDDCKYVSD